jgi:hypothetical protein
MQGATSCRLMRFEITRRFLNQRDKYLNALLH